MEDLDVESSENEDEVEPEDEESELEDENFSLKKVFTSFVAINKEKFRWDALLLALVAVILTVGASASLIFIWFVFKVLLF